MNISIALCTYNGAQFLEEQLNSIKNQTTLPFELIVCDDQSTDNTIKILERFAQDSLFPVIIYKNTTKLGHPNNFLQCINHCSGEAVLLCDQDDIWENNKVEAYKQQFADHPKTTCIISDATVIDATGDQLHQSLWELQKVTERWSKQTDSQLKRTLVNNRSFIQGMVLGIGPRLLTQLTQLENSTINISHDHFLFILSSIIAPDTILALPQKLVRYRKHNTQQVGITEQDTKTSISTVRTKKAERTTYFERSERWHANLLSTIKRLNLENDWEAFITDSQAFLTKRMERTALSKLTFPLIHLIKGTYKKLYTHPLKEAVRDFL